MKQKILIIGNSISALALGKKMSEYCDVFIAPIVEEYIDFATCVDIREDSVKDLLEFVVENGIDLTIPVSETAIQSDLAEIFAKNRQPVFGPSKKSSEITCNKPFAKKVMYKLRIPTPKFGIFDKENMAIDYLKNQTMPCVIKTNDKHSAVVVTDLQVARNIVNRIFIEKNARVLIEDYIYGTPFSFYTITDGYKALPIGSSIVYKHATEGDGGQITDGRGSIVPNYKLSIYQENFIINEIIYPVLEHLDMNGNPYLGILGVNGIITDEKDIVILGFQSFMQNVDACGILNHINENLYNLFDSCVVGAFSDEIDFINIDERASATVVLSCKNRTNNENVISGLDNLDEDTQISFYPTVTKNKYLEYQVNSEGNVAILTTSASSAGNAVNKIYDEIQGINFIGINYRKDIK